MAEFAAANPDHSNNACPTKRNARREAGHDDLSEGSSIYFRFDIGMYSRCGEPV
jgi:hypothetical protein